MSVEGSNSESDAFNEFVELCESHGLLGRPQGLSPEDVCDGLTDEVTLKRFFYARNGDAHAAFQQFKDAVEIRNSVHNIAIYENIDVPDYEATRKLYPHWSGRRDKRGLPICTFDIAFLHREAMADYKKTRDMPLSTEELPNPNATQRAIAFHETLTRFVLPLCSAMRNRPNPESPVSSAVYLVDVSSFGLRQALEVRNYAQDISKLLATSFPEVVDKVFVLNAPSYFGKIWNLLKKFIDPQTASKLVILSKDEVLPALSALLDFDTIPKEYGGNFTFQHGGVPKLETSICDRLEWLSVPRGELPDGPIKWIADGEGNKTAVAVGTVNGQRRSQPIAVLSA